MYCRGKGRCRPAGWTEGQMDGRNRGRNRQLKRRLDTSEEERTHHREKMEPKRCHLSTSLAGKADVFLEEIENVWSLNIVVLDIDQIIL